MTVAAGVGANLGNSSGVRSEKPNADPKTDDTQIAIKTTAVMTRPDHLLAENGLCISKRILSSSMSPSKTLNIMVLLAGSIERSAARNSDRAYVSGQIGRASCRES